MLFEIHDNKINDLQKASISYIIPRLMKAHFTNLQIRINGNYEYEEADWIKHLVQVDDRITPLESQLASALAVIAMKDELISQCIENNLHLADGDNCTLKLAKDALAIKPGDVSLVEVGELRNGLWVSGGFSPDMSFKLYAIQTKE